MFHLGLRGLPLGLRLVLISCGLIKTGTPDQVEELSVGSLVAGCGPDRRGGDCIAARARSAIRVGTQRWLDPQLLGVGLFGALVAVVGTTCLAICSNRSGWAYVGTAVGYVVMFVRDHPLF